MAILNLGEFEAVISNVLMRIEKELGARGTVPPLESTRDELQRLRTNAKNSAKVKAMRGRIEECTDIIAKEIPNDAWVLDAMWDIVDYIDYRA